MLNLGPSNPNVWNVKCFTSNVAMQSHTDCRVHADEIYHGIANGTGLTEVIYAHCDTWLQTIFLHQLTDKGFAQSP